MGWGVGAVIVLVFCTWQAWRGLRTGRLSTRDGDVSRRTAPGWFWGSLAINVLAAAAAASYLAFLIFNGTIRFG
jgi:hypothetical protein